MAGAERRETTSARLDRLLRYFDADSANEALVRDVIDEAFAARSPEIALSVLDTFASKGGRVSPEFENLRALAYMNSGRFSDALPILEQLSVVADDPVLRLNVAHCRFMIGDFQRVAELLDTRILDEHPSAARMKVQALHHLGRPNEALEAGIALVTDRPADPELHGAIALAALDADDLTVAREQALAGLGTAEGAVVFGLLELADGRPETALTFIDDSLRAKPESARALVGKGLALAALGRLAEAADYLGRGAEGFVDHLGSWIALGWVQLAGGDLVASRATFERALSIDPTFAETHAGLGVLAHLSGNRELARTRMDTARRLDRGSAGAALGASLIAAQGGDDSGAQSSLDAILSAPVLGSGSPLATVLAKFSGPQKPD